MAWPLSLPLATGHAAAAATAAAATAFLDLLPSAWNDERCVADDLIKVEHLHAYRLHCKA